MAEILIVRHGQAAFGTDDYDRLTEQGWRQAQLLGRYFRSVGVTLGSVFMGSLRRHRETLAGIADAFDTLPDVAVLPGLNEYDFHGLVAEYGRLQQQTIDHTNTKAFYSSLRAALLAWERRELQGSETFAEFHQRVLATRDTLAAATGPVLVVTSGGAASALAAEVLGADVATLVNLNLQSRNTGVSRYFCKNGRWSMNQFNSVPHLDNAELQHLISYT
ncbi:histidine phosphatase family protein [Spongiibacter taiwanensis]|uniref:histidine phosphatase family protein n=1 Tax=Spongiibacter taiwanensis TaxID=1748242 RepID=UPI002035077F|nr:histidine phosphatase family protein [Spongiibacter taiwanensis]USA42857.1 histidine phosphatase family protein [Spongiibacter taiwanensis]